MYHNLINNIHVLFVHNVHIIVNRIKIEIQRMVEKKVRKICRKLFSEKPFE